MDMNIGFPFRVYRTEWLYINANFMFLYTNTQNLQAPIYLSHSFYS
jgi:hypothetical protein